MGVLPLLFQLIHDLLKNGITQEELDIVKGNLKGTILSFAQALDTLDPLNRARAIEQLFGKFQFARLSTLFKNVATDGSQAARALDLAGASIEELSILSEREMKKIENSTTFKFQAAMEKLKQDLMPVGEAFLKALLSLMLETLKEQ